MAGFNDEQVEQLQTFFEGSELRIKKYVDESIQASEGRMKTYVKETVKEVVAPLRKDIRELRGVTEQIGKAETDEGEARREDVDAVATQYVQLDKRMERVERAHDLEPVSH